MIDRGQPWQNSIETNFNVMRRMADHDYAKATSWAEVQVAHARFFQNYNQQSHSAHGDRPKGRRSPAAVLGWVHGAWCAPVSSARNEPGGSAEATGAEDITGADDCAVGIAGGGE